MRCILLREDAGYAASSNIGLTSDEAQSLIVKIKTANLLCQANYSHNISSVAFPEAHSQTRTQPIPKKCNIFRQIPKVCDLVVPGQSYGFT